MNEACEEGYTKDTAITAENCRACTAAYKNDGTGKCVSLSAACDKAFKDDGSGTRCVAPNTACATGYTRDPTIVGENCKGCIAGYKNNGLGTCVLLNAACGTGYVNDTTVGTDNCRGCASGYKNDGSGKCVL